VRLARGASIKRTSFQGANESASQSSYHVKSVALVGSLVTVIASISIPCSEGVVTREATGCEDSDAKGYGDACSNAEAMALKRAAAKFGLGLHLYQK
jgi:DNA repair RAD52-like protein 1, mitochondrial